MSSHQSSFHLSNHRTACKNFTLKLQSLYQELKSQQGKVDEFEVVFCSMDQSEAEYAAYIRTMPWLCIPLGHPQIDALAKVYGVRGVPHLVVLDKCGKILLNDGVNAVSRDPHGIHFPWRPKPIVELFPVCYYQNDKTMLPTSRLADQYVMLFFGASWCPVSRAFSPKLSEAYSALRKNHQDFELLFVSLDDKKEAFWNFFRGMTFCTLPFQEQNSTKDMLSRLGVESLPAVVMLSPCPSDGGDRIVINTNVRPIIEKDDYIVDFPFHPKQYGDLNKTSVNILSLRCVVVFHEAGDDCEHENTKEAIQLAAHKLEQVDPDLTLFWALEQGGFAQHVRDALQLPLRKEPIMVLLDIQNDGAYYISDTAYISMESIVNFVQAPGERLKLC